jgi:hypothetical protein
MASTLLCNNAIAQLILQLRNITALQVNEAAISTQETGIHQESIYNIHSS